jgi:hypothetical protein
MALRRLPSPESAVVLTTRTVPIVAWAHVAEKVREATNRGMERNIDVTSPMQ